MGILWVGDWGRATSFSRISEEVVPRLLWNTRVGLLAPPKAAMASQPNVPGLSVWHVGDPVGEGTWEAFDRSCPEGESVLSKNMKYAVWQAATICRSEGYGCVIFVMGIYEADWFAEYRDVFGETKLAVWTPIDYIPSPQAIGNLAKADILATMSKSVLPWLPKGTYALGHGISQGLARKVPRNKALRRLRWLAERGRLDLRGDPQVGDVLVLNANTYVERKQIRLSLEAIRRLPGPKLWLHTDLRNPGLVALLEEYEDIADRLVLTQSGQPDWVLCLVYNACQVGLQTSWGEGWSLTNCEHAYLGAPQVVPNFLACGEHFRKYAYPVATRTQRNEAGHEVTVADIRVADILPALRRATDPRAPKEDLRDYFRSHSWDNVAKGLREMLSKECKDGREAQVSGGAVGGGDWGLGS